MASEIKPLERTVSSEVRIEKSKKEVPTPLVIQIKEYPGEQSIVVESKSTCNKSASKHPKGPTK